MLFELATIRSIENRNPQVVVYSVYAVNGDRPMVFVGW